MRASCWVVCLLLAFAPCACRKAAGGSGGLKKAIQGLSSRAPCDRVIPMEWFHSLPVPTGRAAGKEFEVFFYPRGQHGAPDFVNAPLGLAVFDLEGKVYACNRFPGAMKGLSAKRWPESVANLSIEQLEAGLDALYADSEKVAALYAAQAPATEQARRSLQEYGRKFLGLAEPALRSYYYKMNPDFWEYLSQSGAPVLAKP